METINNNLANRGIRPSNEGKPADFEQYFHKHGNYNLKKNARDEFITKIANDKSNLFKPKLQQLRDLRTIVNEYIRLGGLSSSAARAYLVKNIRKLKQADGAWQIRNLFDNGKKDGLWGGYNYAKFFKGVLELSFGDSNVYVAERFFKIASQILRSFPIVDDQFAEHDPRYTEITIENSYIQSCSNPTRVMKEVCRLQEILDKMTYYSMHSSLGIVSYDYVVNSDKVLAVLTELRPIMPDQDFKAMLECLMMHYSEVLPNRELRSPEIVVKLLEIYGLNWSNSFWRCELINSLLARANVSTNIDHASRVADVILERIIKAPPPGIANLMPQIIICLQKFNREEIRRSRSCNIGLLSKGVQILVDQRAAVSVELHPRIYQIIQQLTLDRSGSYQNLAWKLFENYVQEWDPATTAPLLQNLMRNQLAEPYSIRGNDHTILSILTRFKQQLINSDLTLYQGLVRLLFNRRYSLIVGELLANHGEFIPDEDIRNVYQNCNSQMVRDFILNYVHWDGGEARNIVLPEFAREPQAIRNWQGGDAFEIHDFTAGLEVEVINILNSLFQEFKIIPKKNFSLDDISEKFSLLENEGERIAANNALKQLKQSDKVEKATLAINFIASFLDNDDLFKDSKLFAVKERWQLWLAQSFVEAGTAYDGPNEVSCPKGIYERLLSGLRIFHPAINAIFLASNTLQSYKKGFNSKAKDKDVVNAVVNDLRLKGVRSSDPDFTEQWKQAFRHNLQLNFKQEMEQGGADLLAKLDKLPQTQAKVKMILETRFSECESVLPKILDQVAHLIWVTYTNEDAKNHDNLHKYKIDLGNNQEEDKSLIDVIGLMLDAEIVKENNCE